jgi:hypothetical protein
MKAKKSFLTGIFFLIFIILILGSLAWASNIAILQFEDKSPTPSPTGALKARELFVDLFPLEYFTVIDKEAVDKILTPETLKEIGELTAESASLLGKVLGADIIIKGSFKSILSPTTRRESLFINADFVLVSVKDVAGIRYKILSFFERAFMPEGIIASIKDKEIKINLGRYHGINIGDKFTVFSEKLPVAKIIINEVGDFESCATLIDESAKIKVGNLVRKSVAALGKRKKNITVVTSEPKGASIYLDNKWLGTTPLLIEGLEDGTYCIRLKKAEYIDFEGEFTIPSKDIGFINASLILARMDRKEEKVSPPTGTLIIDSVPTNAKVYLNDQLKGVTPLVLKDFPAGTYDLKVSEAGYFSFNKKILIKETETKRINVKLEPLIEEVKERITIPEEEVVLPPSRIISCPTPFTCSVTESSFALCYPEGVIARFGIKTSKDKLRKLEARIEGLGFGLKERLKDLAIDVLYSVYNFRENLKEETLKILFVRGWDVDLPLGLTSVYAGIGYMYNFTHETNSDFRYFVGGSMYILPRIELLTEYDNFEGVAFGCRVHLPYKLHFDAALGYHKGKYRYDFALVYPLISKPLPKPKKKEEEE